MGYLLHITNKNYSSWSLRPWVLMRALGIAFDEVLHRFTRGSAPDFREISPSGKVPWLVDGDTVVWDTLAIAEYLAERHPGVWPADAAARAWARCAAAEMHSGFSVLRGQHGMNVGVRVAVAQRSPELLADIARIERLWNEGLARFGGPFLAGPAFSAVDAFYAPVAYRFRTYGITSQGAAAGYMETMLAHPAMREWEAAALAEDFRDPPHEDELAQIGRVTADLRVPAR
ncbi:glutathione S-transferase family protein [Sulfuritalea sp.]|uniref:glutathione S-transferase family protein n=1 Tax=Sulfuritalea sp. TaxID=2480090 RepID=UPI001AC1E5F1|nr:glutathione S-transferase family protein [Sulfuritalea sp.]MBN8476632.1 glutathione S-transferase family protein [Sulfuritalea sp.]